MFAVGTAMLLNGAVSFFIRLYTVRFLDPAEYGALSLGLNCLLMFDALAGSALDLGTMGLLTGGKRCDTLRIQPVEKAAIRLKLGLGGAVAAFFALAGEWLGYGFLHAAGGRAFFMLVTAAGAGILLVRSAQLYFQARLRFRVFGAIDLTHAGLRLTLVCAVLYSGAASALAILGCYALAAAGVIAAFFVYGYRAAEWGKVRAAVPDVRAVLRSSAPIMTSLSVSSVVSRLDVFMLALFSSPTELGLYGAALTVATIPEILGSYLAPVFLPSILPACKAGTFVAFFKRFHAIAYAAVGMMLAGALVAGKPAMALFLPARYTPSIGLVLVLLPGTLAAASFFPLTLNFLMLTRPRTFLLVDGIAAPLLVAAYFLLLPAYGALAAAWIGCVHRAAKAVVVQSRAYALAHGAVQCAPAVGSAPAA